MARLSNATRSKFYRAGAVTLMFEITDECGFIAQRLVE
jgi:hypothetical protein